MYELVSKEYKTQNGKSAIRYLIDNNYQICNTSNVILSEDR